MSNLESLEKIKSVYSLKYDLAISKVAILEKEHLRVKNKLDEILSYYNEYCDFFKKKSSQGLGIHQFKNHCQFISQFSPVITQQKKIIQDLELKITQEKKQLFNHYKDFKSLEHILSKKNAELLSLKSKQEITSQEEHFVNMHFNKN